MMMFNKTKKKEDGYDESDDHDSDDTYLNTHNNKFKKYGVSKASPQHVIRLRKKLEAASAFDDKRLKRAQIVPSGYVNYKDFLNQQQQKNKEKSSRRLSHVVPHKQGCPIDPRHPALKAWTVLLLFCVFFEIIVTPFGVGFIPLTIGPSSLDYIEAILDCVFIADFILNFFTAIKGLDGRLVRDYKAIASNYHANSLWLDFFTSIPFSLFLLIVDFTIFQENDHGVVDLELLALVKVLRILKISKFVRFFRTRTTVKRTRKSCGFQCQASFATLYRYKQIGTLVGGAMLACHLIACGFGLLPKLVTEFVPDSWNTALGLSGTDIWEEYCAAFYFAIVTLTSVGYGDVHPQNTAERFYSIVVIMVGALLYGFFIGSMTQLTVKHDANFLEISAKMDCVAAYVKVRHFPDHIRRRVMSYYEFLYRNQTALDEYAILMELPEHLRHEAIDFLVKQHFFQVPFVTHMWKDEHTDCVVKIIASLRSQSFEAGQVVVEAGDTGSELFIVMTGELHAINSKDEFLCTLTVGDHFGEFSAFGVTKTRSATVIAGTTTTTYIITPAALQYAFSNFPKQFAEIKHEVQQRAISLSLNVIESSSDNQKKEVHNDACKISNDTDNNSEINVTIRQKNNNKSYFPGYSESRDSFRRLLTSPTLSSDATAGKPLLKKPTSIGPLSSVLKQKEKELKLRKKQHHKNDPVLQSLVQPQSHHDMLTKKDSERSGVNRATSNTVTVHHTKQSHAPVDDVLSDTPKTVDSTKATSLAHGLVRTNHEKANCVDQTQCDHCNQSALTASRVEELFQRIEAIELLLNQVYDVVRH